MEDKIISAALASRDAFEKIEAADGFSAFSDKGQIIYRTISEFYTSDPSAKMADPEIILSRICRAHPKHEELFTTIIGGLSVVSSSNVTQEVIDLRLQDVREQMVGALSSASDDRLEELLEVYFQLKSSEDEVLETAITYNSMGVEAIASHASEEQRIQIYPDAINRTLGGGAYRGHHGLVFARPDVGKTTFGVEMTHGFLKQGLRVMYVGNEDPPEDLMRRFISRIVGKPFDVIMRNADRADQVLAKRNWNNFYFVEMTPGTPKEIRSKVDEIRPDVLIVDQSINISMGISDSVQQLAAVERFLRNLGKQYRMLTISFAQAGDSGDNRLHLTMGDLYGSNTGMQASADFMIGVGMNEEAERNGYRMLSFPKNKLSGDKDPKRVSMNFSIFKVG